jgi:hypothetical protein
MTDTERMDLRSRALFCQTRGYDLARLSAYIDDLGGGEAPPGITTGSILHLIALIDGYQPPMAPAEETPKKGGKKAHKAREEPKEEAPPATLPEPPVEVPAETPADQAP